MTSLLNVILISFAVGLAFAAPAENATKIEAPKIELVQPQGNSLENVELAEDMNDRILKGEKAPKNAFPFTVSLQMQHPKVICNNSKICVAFAPRKSDYNTKTVFFGIAKTGPPGAMHKFCGGSIIAANVVLTAAHCFEPMPTTTIYIRAGSTHAFDPNGQLVAVAQIIKHPCYAPQNIYQIPHLNDIALLILAEPLKFSQSVQPISIATDAHNAESARAGKVMGWGATHGSDHSQSAIELLYKDIPVISPNQCAKYFRVHSNVLCVSNGDDSEAGPCVGDSGGPFIQKSGTKEILVGLTSYGSTTCGKIPTVYTRISKYLDFINDVLQGRPIYPVCA